MDEILKEDSDAEHGFLYDSSLEVKEIPEPEYDERSVLLSWYDSDLNLVIDEANFIAASPLHEAGFGYFQAGARATYGFSSGKVCFEVKILDRCKLERSLQQQYPHFLRVGWSSMRASLVLGADHKSYGYDSCGQSFTFGEISNYGKEFSTGDVVGAYLDIGDSVVFSFTLNGKDLGVAYNVPQSKIQKEALFPHILTKNVSYECNFHGKKPWFPPKSGFTFVGDIPLKKRIAGPVAPKTKADCEVIMMVGLPLSGKTSWVNKLRENNPGKYYILDTVPLMDKREVTSMIRKRMLSHRAQVLTKLISLAVDRRRNYILDQMNITICDHIWKLDCFKKFRRRMVVVVISEEEFQKRIKSSEDKRFVRDWWLLTMKAKFYLPRITYPQYASIVDSIEYVGLPEAEALKIVKSYNKEAWNLGYKPPSNWDVYVTVKKKKKKKKKNVTNIELVHPKNKDKPDKGSWVPSPKAKDTASSSKVPDGGRHSRKRSPSVNRNNTWRTGSRKRDLSKSPQNKMRSRRDAHDFHYSTKGRNVEHKARSEHFRSVERPPAKKRRVEERDGTLSRVDEPSLSPKGHKVLGENKRSRFGQSGRSDHPHFDGNPSYESYSAKLQADVALQENDIGGVIQPKGQFRDHLSPHILGHIVEHEERVMSHSADNAFLLQGVGRGNQPQISDRVVGGFSGPSHRTENEFPSQREGFDGGLVHLQGQMDGLGPGMVSEFPHYGQKVDQNLKRRMAEELERQQIRENFDVVPEGIPENPRGVFEGRKGQLTLNDRFGDSQRAQDDFERIRDEMMTKGGPSHNERSFGTRSPFGRQEDLPSLGNPHHNELLGGFPTHDGRFNDMSGHDRRFGNRQNPAGTAENEPYPPPGVPFSNATPSDGRFASMQPPVDQFHNLPHHHDGRHSFVVDLTHDGNPPFAPSGRNVGNMAADARHVGDPHYMTFGDLPPPDKTPYNVLLNAMYGGLPPGRQEMDADPSKWPASHGGYDGSQLSEGRHSERLPFEGNLCNDPLRSRGKQSLSPDGGQIHDALPHKSTPGLMHFERGNNMIDQSDQRRRENFPPNTGMFNENEQLPDRWERDFPAFKPERGSDPSSNEGRFKGSEPHFQKRQDVEEYPAGNRHLDHFPIEGQIGGILRPNEHELHTENVSSGGRNRNFQPEDQMGNLEDERHFNLGSQGYLPTHDGRIQGGSSPHRKFRGPAAEERSLVHNVRREEMFGRDRPAHKEGFGGDSPSWKATIGDETFYGSRIQDQLLPGERSCSDFPFRGNFNDPSRGGDIQPQHRRSGSFDRLNRFSTQAEFHSKNSSEKHTFSNEAEMRKGFMDDGSGAIDHNRWESSHVDKSSKRLGNESFVFQRSSLSDVDDHLHRNRNRENLQHIRGKEMLNPELPFDWKSDDARRPGWDVIKGDHENSPQKLQKLIGNNARFCGVENDVGEAIHRFVSGAREDWDQAVAANKAATRSNWERQVLIMPEEESEQLAPYERPFNQALWDSNEQDIDSVPPSKECFREGSGANAESWPRESTSISGNKARGSVWQRVGGYVHEEDNFNSAHPGHRPHHSNYGSPSHGSIERECYEDSEERRRIERNRRRRQRPLRRSSSRYSQMDDFSERGRSQWGGLERESQRR